MKPTDHKSICEKGSESFNSFMEMPQYLYFIELFNVFNFIFFFVKTVVNEHGFHVIHWGLCPHVIFPVGAVALIAPVFPATPGTYKRVYKRTFIH